jgi:probable FeS assembly SUF system protein SufT
MQQGFPDKTIILKRDCPAVAVPEGKLGLLQANEAVQLHQALGDSFSVSYQGNLYRIQGVDSDALGLEVAVDVSALIKDVSLSQDDKILGLLKTIFDPEIPVNIYDLGLIYGAQCFPLDCEEKVGKQRIHVTMTLTAPGCGMGPFLVQDVKQKLMLLPGVVDVVVELVFDPPWSHDRMSPEAKLQTGLIY